jgi:phosphoenolpyruvate carboxykinase (ATP)
LQETGVRNGAFGADKFGLKKLKAVNWNFGAPQLYEHALSAGEAVVSADGALCADTGEFTGRSPKDKFTVRDATTDTNMWWAGNQSITSEQFEALYKDFLAHAEGMTLHGGRFSELVRIPPPSTLPTIAASLLVDCVQRVPCPR